MTSKKTLVPFRCSQKANLARLATKSASNWGYQFHPLQNRTSEALAKHSSGFAPIVCVSKIKQDSANLALAQETTKTPKYVARHVRCFYYMF